MAQGIESDAAGNRRIVDLDPVQLESLRRDQEAAATARRQREARQRRLVKRVNDVGDDAARELLKAILEMNGVKSD